MRLKLRISQIALARFLLLAAMGSLAFALLRNSLIAGFFEEIKTLVLVAAVVFLFYHRPVLRVSLASAIMWSFLAVVTVSTVYNSANSPQLIVSIAVFVAIAVYFQAINGLAQPEKILFPLLYWFAIVVVISSLFFVAVPASYIGGRFAAGFINTNVASGYIAIAVVVLSYVVIFEKPRFADFFILGAAVLLLLLTKGRGGLVSAFAPVTVMLLTDWKLRLSRMNLMRFAFLATAWWLFMQVTVAATTRADQLGLLAVRAFEVGGREAIIERHFAAFWHSPFIGAGAVIDKTTLYARTSGESSYTDLLALSGGIGSFLIVALIVRALWVQYYRSKNRLGFYVLLSTLCLAVSEGYFVSLASPVSMILWSMLAMSPRKSSPV